MKKTLLFAFLSMFSYSLFAQCEPDPIYTDTTGMGGLQAFGVFPVPYDSLTMLGGINSSACINEPYEFVLTAVVPDVIEVSGVTVGLNKIEVTPTGAISGLPVGMTYACNPPNCVFEANTNGCIVLTGTATDANAPGEYPLSISMTIDSDLLVLPTTYPGDLFPGSYSLTVEPEGSDNCTVVGTTSVLKENLSFQNVPNPFANFTQVQITSGIHQSVSFEVYNMIGQRLHEQSIDLIEGENAIDFDASALVNGMYIYSLRSGADVISKRMIVQK